MNNQLEINNEISKKFRVEKIVTEEGKAIIISKMTNKGIEMIRATLIGFQICDASGIHGIPLIIADLLFNDYFHTDKSEIRILNSDGTYTNFHGIPLPDHVGDEVLRFPGEN